MKFTQGLNSTAVRGDRPSEDVRLELRPLKVLIGANGADESNLLSFCNIPDYAQGSACVLGSMETRAQAPRKPVIPRHRRENGEKAGIQGPLIEVDSCFHGNDGPKKAIHLIFIRNQVKIWKGDWEERRCRR